MSHARPNKILVKGLLELLLDLVDANITSQIELQAGGDQATDSAMRLWFQTLAGERYAQAMELKYLRRAMSVGVDEDASWPGDLHGDPVEVRAAGVRGVRALLDSVEASERRLESKYEDALPYCAAGTLQEQVREHLVAIRRAGMRFQEMRQAYERKMGVPTNTEDTTEAY